MKKHVIRIVLGAAGLLCALTLLLALHIYLVTRPTTAYHAAVQLSRIDFKLPADNTQLQQAAALVRRYPGVGHVYLNPDHGTLVYGYRQGTVDPGRVLDSVRQLPLAARAFVPAPEAATTGCPVLDKSSLTYRFGTFIQNIFH